MSASAASGELATMRVSVWNMDPKGRARAGRTGGRSRNTLLHCGRPTRLSASVTSRCASEVPADMNRSPGDLAPDARAPCSSARTHGQLLFGQTAIRFAAVVVPTDRVTARAEGGHDLWFP